MAVIKPRRNFIYAYEPLDGDPDVLAMAGKMLVDGIVQHLEHTMVQAALVGVANVHAGPLPDRLEALQFVNLLGAIGLAGGDIGGHWVVV